MFVRSRKASRNNIVTGGRTWRSHFRRSFFSATGSMCVPRPSLMTSTFSSARAGTLLSAILTAANAVVGRSVVEIGRSGAPGGLIYDQHAAKHTFVGCRLWQPPMRADCSSRRAIRSLPQIAGELARLGGMVPQHDSAPQRTKMEQAFDFEKLAPKRSNRYGKLARSLGGWWCGRNRGRCTIRESSDARLGQPLMRC
jgi:hypothetical protein